MGGRRDQDLDEERIPAFEPAGNHPFAALDNARAVRKRRALDALAGSLLAAAAVAVMVNVFAFQNGNRPNLMFGFQLPAGLANRISLAPPDPPAPVPAPAPAAVRPAAVAPPAPAAAAAPAAPAAAPPQSITALLNGTAPAPTAPRPPQPLVADVQRELAKRGFYDGPADGRTGPKTEAAIRAYEQSARLRVSGEASEALLAQMRRSPAGLVPPANVGAAADITGAVRPPGEVPASPRVLAVQKTLSKLGYGPLKVTGRPSAETRQAVQRFERDRNLPADGEISDRLVRELAAVSGTAIE